MAHYDIAPKKAKMTGHDIALASEFRKSCKEEISSNENKIDALIARNKVLKKQSSNNGIAEKFEVTTNHMRRCLQLA